MTKERSQKLKRIEFGSQRLFKSSLLLSFLTLFVFTSNCHAQIRVHKLEIVNRFPHDSKAFTQGLIFHEGNLLEGTGQFGESQLRVVVPETGKVTKLKKLHRKLFGEGITLVRDEVFQITWQNKIAIVYDLKTFREKRRFTYSGEGWGLTYDGKYLIMSDGTDRIQFRDPRTFRYKGEIKVRYNSRPLKNLNELEFINGEIFANIWHSEYIARIDPKTGRVLGMIDISGLNPYPRAKRDQAVANGIAYDDKTGRLFLTGKYWPILYEVKIKP